MKKSLPRILIVGLILAAVLLSLVLVPGAGLAQPSVPRKHKALTDELQQVQEVSPELAMSKIDPLLQEAAEQGGKDLVDLYVSVKAGTDLSEYLSRMIVRPVIFGGTQNIYGQTIASNLLKIAQEPNVLALVKVSAELREMPYDPETEDAPARAIDLARLEALRDDPVLGMSAHILLAGRDAAPNLPPHLRQWAVLEGLAVAVDSGALDDEDTAGQIWEMVDADADLDTAWRSPHPQLIEILDAVATQHPKGRTRKAAKKALFKARQREDLREDLDPGDGPGDDSR